MDKGRFASVQDLAEHIRIIATIIKQRLRPAGLETIVAHADVSIVEDVAWPLASLHDSSALLNSWPRFRASLRSEIHLGRADQQLQSHQKRR